MSFKNVGLLPSNHFDPFIFGISLWKIGFAFRWGKKGEQQNVFNYETFLQDLVD